MGLLVPINDNDQFGEVNAHTQALAYTQAGQQHHLGADSADHEVNMGLADAGWEQVMTPVIEPVLASVQGADSMKTLAQRLAAAGLKMDHKVLQKALSEAGFHRPVERRGCGMNPALMLLLGGEQFTPDNATGEAII